MPGEGTATESAQWMSFAQSDELTRDAEKCDRSQPLGPSRLVHISWAPGPTAQRDFARALWTALRRNQTPVVGPPGVVPTIWQAQAPSEVEPGLQEPKQPHAIGFATSGSAGEPRVYFRTWNSLVQEAETISRDIGLLRGSPFLSLVPSHHLYGFIFAFVLPRLLGSQVTHVEVSDAPLQLSQMRHQKGVWVISPALWNTVMMCLQQSVSPDARELSLISSGAPWGERRAEEACEMIRVGRLGRIIDVLGSTESGGMGFTCYAGQTSASVRAADSGGDSRNPVHELTPFTNVDIRLDGEQWTVRSPFVAGTRLSPETIALEDVFVRTPAGRLRHIGRADRIFKAAGKRFSLQTVEDLLRKFEGVTDARCYYQRRDDLPKGGVLIAFVIAPEAAFLRISRENWAQKSRPRSDLPFPDRIARLEQWPQNSLGKVTLADLEDATKT